MEPVPLGEIDGILQPWTDISTRQNGLGHMVPEGIKQRRYRCRETIFNAGTMEHNGAGAIVPSAIRALVEVSQPSAAPVYYD